MKLLVWDFDGTLGHCDGLWSGVFAYLLSTEAPDHPVEHHDIVAQLQTGFPWHTPDIPHPHIVTASEWWDSMLPIFLRVFRSLNLDETRAAQLAAMVRARYCSRERWQLFPDTLAALDRLSEAGWRHALLSNHVPELDDILLALGIHSCFERIVNSAVSGYEKPNPASFAKAIENWEPCEERWMIGDSFAADYQGARAVGWHAALVRREHPQATPCFPDLTSLSDFLIGRSNYDARPPL